MQSRRKLLLLAGCLLAAAVLVGLFARTPEPSYNGRKLSRWLTIYGHSLPKRLSVSTDIDLDPGTGDPEASAALRQFGTNALPTLLAWVRKDQTPVSIKTRAAWLLLKTPRSFRPRAMDKWIERQMDFAFLYSQAGTAMSAFALLGKSASPSIPELRRMMYDPKCAGRAAWTLAVIDTNAISFFITCIGDPYAPGRATAISYFSRCNKFRTNGAPAVPALAKCLSDPQLPIRQAAVEALGRVGRQPDIAVPALKECMNFQEDDVLRWAAMSALSAFGPEARSAAPAPGKGTEGSQ